MIIEPVMELLFAEIPKTSDYSEKVEVRGSADRKFGRWPKE